MFLLFFILSESSFESLYENCSIDRGGKRIKGNVKKSLPFRERNIKSEQKTGASYEQVLNNVKMQLSGK